MPLKRGKLASPGVAPWSLGEEAGGFLPGTDAASNPNGESFSTLETGSYVYGTNAVWTGANGTTYGSGTGSTRPTLSGIWVEFVSASAQHLGRATDGLLEYFWNGAGGTCIAVVRPDVVTAQALWSNQGSTTEKGYQLGTTNLSPSVGAQMNIGAGFLGSTEYSDNNVATGTPIIIICRMDGVADTISLRMNGVQGTPQSYTSWQGDPLPTNWNFMGCNGWANQHYDGGIGALAAVPSVWSNAECALAEAWAVDNFGVTL